MSPHIQQQQQQQPQNGFQTLSLPPANTVGGQQGYATQPGAAVMAVAMNAQHANSTVGSVPVAVACPPTAEVSGQGTWTGNSTLTYTQTMQPPDPRTHHPSYCILFIILLPFLFFGIRFEVSYDIFREIVEHSLETQNKIRNVWDSIIFILGSVRNIFDSFTFTGQNFK